MARRLLARNVPAHRPCTIAGLLPIVDAWSHHCGTKVIAKAKAEHETTHAS
jgi:hypothetical protein